MRYHHLPIRSANIRKLGNPSLWGMWRKENTHALLEGDSFMKLGMQMPYNPASSLLGHRCQRNLSTDNVLNGTVYSIRNWGQPRSMSLGSENIKYDGCLY